MLSVIASISVKPGHKDEFLSIFKENVPLVLEEEGCIEYAPMLDVPTGWPIQEVDDNVVTIVEKWDDLEALKAHLASPHMKAYGAKTKHMVQGLSVKILTGA